MAKAQLKTQMNDASVVDFLESIPDETQRADAKTINQLMQDITGAPPKMWGSSLVGYGAEQLHYASGRELDWFLIGFSPRKNSLSLYVLREGEEQYTDLLAKLGKHSTGKGCLYIKRLSEVDQDVLKELLRRSLKRKHH